MITLTMIIETKKQRTNSGHPKSICTCHSHENTDCTLNQCDNQHFNSHNLFFIFRCTFVCVHVRCHREKKFDEVFRWDF